MVTLSTTRPFWDEPEMPRGRFPHFFSLSQDKFSRAGTMMSDRPLRSARRKAMTAGAGRITIPFLASFVVRRNSIVSAR